MVEIISFFVFIASAAGILMMVVRKIPVLTKLSDDALGPRMTGAKNGFLVFIEGKLKSVPMFRDFSWLGFLQKLLLKGRVMVLKVDNKINDYMVKLRQKSEDQRKKEDLRLDNYWHELKTIVKGRGPSYKRNPETLVVETEDMPKPEVIEIQKTEIEVEVSQPVVQKVAMPETVEQKIVRSKKRHAQRKKKVKDPFQW